MNKNKEASYESVLAIDPHVRGFGYIVFDDPKNPIEWGSKTIRIMKQERTCKAVLKLIKFYKPNILIIQDTTDSKRCARINHLNERLAALAIKHGIKTASIADHDIDVVFAQFGASTKFDIATAIVKWFPALEPKLPHKRKLWEAEDERSALFDAAALAVVYYYLKN